MFIIHHLSHFYHACGHVHCPPSILFTLISDIWSCSLSLAYYLYFSTGGHVLRHPVFHIHIPHVGISACPMLISVISFFPLVYILHEGSLSPASTYFAYGQSVLCSLPFSCTVHIPHVESLSHAHYHTSIFHMRAACPMLVNIPIYSICGQPVPCSLTC